MHYAYKYSLIIVAVILLSISLSLYFGGQNSVTRNGSEGDYIFKVISVQKTDSSGFCKVIVSSVARGAFPAISRRRLVVGDTVKADEINYNENIFKGRNKEIFLVK